VKHSPVRHLTKIRAIHVAQAVKFETLPFP
jgi:hypothetical protein